MEEFAGQLVETDAGTGMALTAVAAALFGSPLFTVIKVMAAIYVAVLLVDLVLVLILSGINESYRKNRRGTNLPTHVEARAKWRRIMGRLKKGDQNHYKAAILEADQMTEKILVDAGYTEPTMGDKIARMRGQHLSGIEALAAAHEMSMRVVQEPDIMLTHDQTEAVLGQYKTFLDDMEIFG